MLDVLQIFFDGNFIPKEYGYLWKPSLVWLHIASDSIVTLSYFSISLLLVYFLRQRPDIPFQKIFWLLCAFSITCGTTHPIALWTLWHPDFGVLGLFEAIAAGVSLYMVWELVPLIPEALGLPNPLDLATANQALVQEIQEHRQTASELRESSQRLSLLVQQSPLAVIEWTTDFEVVAWNPAAERIFGYSRTEVFGRHGFELIVPESAREYVNQVCNQLLEQKGGTRSTNENFTKEGKEIYCEWYNTPLIDSRGQVIGVASLVQDVSKRKLAEEALQQAKNQLEIRVEERTRQLKQASEELKDVITELQREIVQRQQVEAYLREREEQYQSVVDNVKEVIFQTDVNGYWTFLNPAWSEITGFAIAQSIGTFFCDYVHPDDRQRNLEQFQALIEGKKEYCRLEVRYLTKSGGYRWIEVVAQLTFDANRRVIGTCGTLNDITERKQAEVALRESEERFRSLVAHIPGVVYRCACDADWTMEFISDVIEEISGYPAADFLHNQVRTFASAIAPQDRATVERVVLECLAQKQPYVLEYRLLHRDGSVRWVYEKGQGVFATNGSLLCLDGVIFDITEYKQTQENLQSREEQFRQLAENIDEVFWMTSVDKNQMLYVSPAYETIWGRKTASLYEQPRLWLDAIHPEDRDRILSTFEKQQQPGEYDEVYRVVRPDYSVRWIRDRAFPVLDPQGKVYRIAGIAEDITERKQAQAEILNALAKEKELVDLKSRFISITSHEFRTPLTTILSTAELLEYYDWTKEEEVEQLDLIQETVQHMLELLEDLLFIGTADAGQLRFNPEPLDLNQFCQELVAEIQRGMSLKPSSTGVQHILAFASRGQSFLACMDKKLLRQLLGNLLLNAIKYSPGGGRVQFELTCQDDKAIFQIQDQGIGIPEEDQSRLFEFFYRAKNVGAIAGTGLGLAIVKTCVDLHRGEIAVSSKVGVGTQFTVTLPLKNPFFIHCSLC